MRPKEYLMQLKYLDQEIDSNIRLIDELRAKTERIGSFSEIGKVQSSSNINFSDWIDKVIDLEKDINLKIDELVCLKKMIKSQIDKVDNPLYRIVLTNHYLLGLSLLEIARKYNYNYNYIKHIHGHALLAFKDKNKELFIKKI